MAYYICCYRQESTPERVSYFLVDESGTRRGNFQKSTLEDLLAIAAECRQTAVSLEEIPVDTLKKVQQIYELCRHIYPVKSEQIAKAHKLAANITPKVTFK